MKRKITLVGLFGIIFIMKIHAQVPTLIHDIAPVGDDSYISYLTAAGERLYFNGNDGESIKLWSSDGTGDALTALMTVDYYANDFQALGDQVFFRSGDPDTGMELYVTDNTAAGTHLFMEINNGPDDGTGRLLGVHDGLLYFIGNDGVHGNELWTTDGTVSGTNMVKDIHPTDDAVDFNAGQNFWFDGKVYFEANDGIHGWETWSSDGTPNGTNLLLDINTSGDIYFHDAFVKDTEMYFTTVTYGTGSFLWKTDGTTSGTQFIKQIGATSTFGENMILFNDQVYFEVGSYLENQGDIWVTDGTESGTVLFRENSSIGGVMNDELYFIGVTDNNYYAVYKTQGVQGDEEFLIETHEATPWNFPSHVFQVWNDRLYLLVRFEDPSALYVWSFIYSTDGTTAGSHMHLEETGSGGMLIRTGEGLKPFQNGLYFVGSYSNVGEELFAFMPLPGNIAHQIDTNSIDLYPNPASEKIQVISDVGMIGSLLIVDAYGKLIKEIQAFHQMNLIVQIDDLVPGIYFIRAQTTTGQMISRTFVVR
ncbi:MAG: T9SS type A sorting domain-containing protein [Flavobacteriales bacterium]|nr:T9SS type A sorting domain-containing protein [Flavobacteriales bacterium]